MLLGLNFCNLHIGLKSVIWYKKTVDIKKFAEITCLTAYCVTDIDDVESNAILLQLMVSQCLICRGVG